MWTWLIGLLLIGHGLIQASFLRTSPEKEAAGEPVARSRLVSDLRLNEVAVRSAGTLIAAVVVIGFLLAGAGLLGFPFPLELWRTITIVSAAASTLLLTIFWQRWLTLGVSINIVILAALLWLNWSP